MASHPPARAPAREEDARKGRHSNSKRGSTPLAERYDIIGHDSGFSAAVRTASSAARSSATVLLQGESGTGKERIARLVHQESPRAHRGFVAVDCAAIPDSLIESEFYGHERGAFTGAVRRRLGCLERAAGGTLFLDEIGNMSLPSQSKILRAIQEREFRRVGGESAIQADFRIVAATNTDLCAEVAEGRFREDLYYRLNVVTVVVPPLRNRGASDIRQLAEYFAQRFAAIHNRPPRPFVPQSIDLLCAYDWPGNVRQLENAIERAVVLCDGMAIEPRHLPIELHTIGGHRYPRSGRAFRTLADVEMEHIHKAMATTGGSIGRAADLLGIHRNTLRDRLRRSEHAQ